MRIGEALEACARDGVIVGRKKWSDGWHLRVYDPYLPEVTERNGYANTLHLRLCSGWPVPTIWRDPGFNIDELLADDWEILDPANCMAATQVWIVPG